MSDAERTIHRAAKAIDALKACSQYTGYEIPQEVFDALDTLLSKYIGITKHLHNFSQLLETIRK